MLVIDLIVGGVIVGAAIYGWIVGLGRALPVAGFAAGVALGSRLPLLLGQELDSDFALVLALPGALLAGGILAALADRLAPSAARLGERSFLAAASRARCSSGHRQPWPRGRSRRQCPRSARFVTTSGARRSWSASTPCSRRPVRRVSVVQERQGSSLRATVIWFDGIHDLALLRVPHLDAPGLSLADESPPRTRGFSLGFPSGRKAIRRARLLETTTKLDLPTLDLANKAGVSLTMKDRLVTVIRGMSGPGGSGGPVVDRHGRVVATVFAGIPQNGIVLAVPNRIVRSAMRRAADPVRVPGCDAPPLKPTSKESIAARNA